MTDELLDRVRSVDPLPEGSAAPPFESVFASIGDEPRRRGSHRGRRLSGLLVPVVSIAVTIGVIVAAVTLLHAGRSGSHLGGPATDHGHAPNRATVPTPAPAPSVPTGGMPGVVTVWGASFSSTGDGVISLQQCLRCEPNGNQTSHSTDTEWLLTTSDGGRSWTRRVRGYYVQRPVLTGQDGWAGGLQMLSRKQGGGRAAWEPGSGIARFFVTHDGGRNWSVAPSAAPNQGGSFTSLVGGEVWAVGLGSTAAIVHSPAQGDSLIATASLPFQGENTNIGVEGAGGATAYVVNANAPRQAFATHDDGRTWQRLTPPPCTGKFAFARLDAAFGQTVWLTCSGAADRTPTLVRSLDGGHSWRKLPGEADTNGLQQLTAVNARVAWALSGDGDLLRTTDAGVTWQPVWSAVNAKVSPLSRPITKLSASPLPLLSVQSADSASIATLLNRGDTGRAAKLTNLVLYRTTDGGQTWRTYPVGL